MKEKKFSTSGEEILARASQAADEYAQSIPLDDEGKALFASVYESGFLQAWIELTGALEED